MMTPQRLTITLAVALCAFALIASAIGSTNAPVMAQGAPTMSSTSWVPTATHVPVAPSPLPTITLRPWPIRHCGDTVTGCNVWLPEVRR